MSSRSICSIQYYNNSRFVYIAAGEGGFTDAISVRNFHRPSFPQNSSFEQLVKTKHNRPVFSKGHWRQTLRKPKTPKPRSKDKKYHQPSLIEDLIRFGYYDEEYPTTEQQSDEGNFDQATDSPFDYSTYYYDEIIPNSSQTSISSSSNSKEVAMVISRNMLRSNLVAL